MYSEIPVCTHVCSTIILSHRHERLNQKPSWGGRVCISHQWFARDTEWFTLTCFLLMASDRRWLWSDAVCRLLLICVLLETRVTWAILVPFGVNIRVRLMFWPLTTEYKKVQHAFGNHVNNTLLIAMPKPCVIVAPFFLLTQDFKHQKTINIMDLL